MDNFFNSLSLQETLFENGILSCGTLRANRKGMPKKFRSDTEMKRGDIEYFSSGDISCVNGWTIDYRLTKIFRQFLNCFR